MRGKGCMVWNIGTWLGGDARAQAAACLELGLSWVSVKLADGRTEFWRNYTPGLVAELRRVGIEVVGWGWTYGGWWDRGADPDVFYPSKAIAREEGAFHAGLCRRYGIQHFQIDAEKEYKRLPDPGDRLSAYVNAFRAEAPGIELSLCTYRHPLQHSPFPFHVARNLVDAWSPQVYWEGQIDPEAGAEDLAASKRAYDNLKPLPFIPIGPLYRNAVGWTASAEQLGGFFQKALDMAVPAVGFWALDRATAPQVAAVKAMAWPESPIPPAPPLTHVPVPEWARSIDSWARSIGYSGPAPENP